MTSMSFFHDKVGDLLTSIYHVRIKTAAILPLLFIITSFYNLLLLEFKICVGGGGGVGWNFSCCPAVASEPMGQVVGPYMY